MKKSLLVAAVIGALWIGALATAHAQGTVVRPTGGPVGPLWAWDPPDVSVAPGTVVTWKNEGAAPHTVTAYDGPWDDNLDLPAGASAKRKFKKPGVYSYYCTTTSHAVLVGTTCIGMCGSVTVE
ncbi:MAG TPA: plastocyanin/azurin family copper-binding protein [Actinomycetota bacterium]|nr:plastocyanin/azurin family copper-binding protein [Actinomycetota bacterium]